MRIAIVGAGFAGLAAAYYLSLSRQHAITVIDRQGIGSEASGVAAGLLHPFVGQQCRLNPNGMEGLAATMRLLEVAENSLGRRVANTGGILRLPFNARQHEQFALAATRYGDEIQHLPAEKVASAIPGIAMREGFLLARGVTVYCDLYLQGLWSACQAAGVALDIREVAGVDELCSDFDAIILAAGAGIKALQGVPQHPLSYTKGQILEIGWPPGLAPLPLSLNSQIYCAMSLDNRSALVGSTYEKKFDTLDPVLEIAKAEILPKLERLYPPLVGAPLLNCRAGVRVSTPERLPLIRQVTPHCWLFTGLGSRGLLYHALYAQQLAAAVTNEK
jgi:glycine/D-amino acid oxidase-like deaminating enzyme